MLPSDALRITPGDPQLEEAGVWVTYRTVELRIARGNSDAYQKELRDQSAQWRRAHPGEDMPIDVAGALTIELVARHILLGWKGFRFNAQAVEFSEENAVNLLTHDRDVLEFIVAFAAEPRNYEREEAAERGRKSGGGASVANALEHTVQAKEPQVSAVAGTQGAAA